MKRRIISVLLIVILTVGFVLPAGAVRNVNIGESKAARIENVNADGSNFNDDIIDGTSNTVEVSVANLTQSANGNTTVDVQVENERIALSATPTNRSEGGGTVFYSGTTDNTKYDVLYFAYIIDTLKANMYFKAAHSADYPTGTSMLQIYLKDVTSNTRDYLVIEVFDVDLIYSDNQINALPVSVTHGAWAAAEFEPIDEGFGQDYNVTTPRALPSVKYWYCTKSYHAVGEPQTHTIRWMTYLDCTDIDVGKTELQRFCIEVYAKSCEFAYNTDFNSDVESFLLISNVKTCLAAVPGSAWVSTAIDGDVHKESSGSLWALSASIGFSYSALQVSLSFPGSYQYRGTVDLNNTFENYMNDPTTNRYARNIEVELDSNYKLVDIGHKFWVTGTLKDYGNVAKVAAPLKVRYYVDVYNNNTKDVYPYYCDAEVDVAITN